MTDDIVIFHHPAPAGAYDLGDFHIQIARRPRWIHRFFVRVFLGWRWVENQP